MNFDVMEKGYDIVCLDDCGALIVMRASRCAFSWLAAADVQGGYDQSSKRGLLKQIPPFASCPSSFPATRPRSTSLAKRTGSQERSDLVVGMITGRGCAGLRR